MCGIAGIVDSSLGLQDREAQIARAVAAMTHRGPDDSGLESSGAATLGMRRLAIFDPAHGHQPMQTADGRFTLVFNGAIYNFRTLRAELATAGRRFRTECDTEVLLAAFAQWGEGCLQRLRGMFAFAVWDAAENALFLARDPFGIKPLYYTQVAGRLVFASELRALVSSGACAAEIDPRAVTDYLSWLAVPAPRTIYRDISSLRPGECARFQNGKLTLRRTWTFPSANAAAQPCRTREEFTTELKSRLEDSIRAHRIADVPVGAFLSGGLDSAAVVGLMSRVSSAPLRTFSIGFEEADFSEANEAAATAAHFGAQHSPTTLTGARVAADIDRLLAAFDQPTGDGINTYYASEAARRGGVTVALSGLGGDELFGGYPSFRDIPRLSRWLPAWRTLPSPVRRTVARRLAAGDTRRRKLADVLQHARTPHEVGALQRRVFALATRDSLLNPDVRRAASGPFHPELPALATELPGAGAFETASAWELRTYMSDVLLRDSDVMSMQHSLELRVPFIDRPLIEWLWAQPAAFKSDPLHAKHALYAAVRDLLPPVFATRHKRGFSLPFPLWMKRELRPFLDETFSTASLVRADFFDRAAVQRLWQNFIAGDDTREWSRVWSLAVLIAFANRRAAPGPAATTPTPTVAPARGPALTGNTLLLAPEIFASEGGIPRILQSYLRALCDLSAPGAVRLLALNDDRIDAAHLARCGENPIGEWRVCSRNKLKFVAAAVQLARGCERIVCGHVAQLPVAWLARQLNPKIKYYLVAHGIEVWRKFNAAETLALRHAERVLCVSDYTRRELLKNCPLPDGRTIVLPNALDPAFEIAPGRPLAECPPTILVVTRLTYDDRYKGVEHMIAAMPAIRAAIPEAQLRIVGRGDDVSRLQHLAAAAGATDAVTFTGYIDDARLIEEIRTCRLFALPSKKEGFGLVFLEAMARGRPCLGARAGGVPEVISDETGVLVDYGNVAAIAVAAIAALRREWNESAILARAAHLAFPRFRQRCAELLAA